ncbi:hypothetical protein BB381_03815 [Campylobacter pinnipediorum subsp. caledonicus]|uniref:choline kinase family protein n=1 Tax=Campylobacter pinnipediorum TaxID=1965231 RepID=UPI0009948FBE|nr:choline kinase family protein [Campylobacter pinnipediorum]OPA71628.1 hypothetical protein BB381_03815 [Campylobacter pinnipediorum subsp. caledonicus]
MNIIVDIFNKLNMNVDGIKKIGGMTNTNYLVLCGNNKFVARIPGLASNDMIDRSIEKENQILTSEYGFNVPTIFFDKKTGIKITKFLESTTLKPYNINEYSSLIALTLKKLHTSNIPFKNVFEPKIEFKKYLSLMKDKQHFVISDFQKSIKLFDNLCDKIIDINKKDKFYKLSPTHGDIVPENLLYHNKKIYVIDWEYSGLNDPCWDVTSLILESTGFDDLSIPSGIKLEKFISEYNKDLNLKKVEIYKSIQDILWSAWAIVKINAGGDYSKYAKDRLYRAFERESV